MEGLQVIGLDTSEVARRLNESRRRDTERAELRASVAATLDHIDRAIGPRTGSICGSCWAPIATTATSCATCGTNYVTGEHRDHRTAPTRCGMCGAAPYRPGQPCCTPMYLRSESASIEYR